MQHYVYVISMLNVHPKLHQERIKDQGLKKKKKNQGLKKMNENLLDELIDGPTPRMPVGSLRAFG